MKNTEPSFKLDKDLLIIDVEATSVDVDKASIIQLAAVRFKKDASLIEPLYSSYVKPYTDDWDYTAHQVHGITQDFLAKKGKDIDTVILEFEQAVGRTKGYYLAQWTCGFDTTMLQNAYKAINYHYPFSYRAFDIASIVRVHLACLGFNPNDGLAKCCRKLGIDTREFKQHNATDDALYAGMALQKIIKNVMDKKDNHTVKAGQ